MKDTNWTGSNHRGYDQNSGESEFLID